MGLGRHQIASPRRWHSLLRPTCRILGRRTPKASMNSPRTSNDWSFRNPKTIGMFQQLERGFGFYVPRKVRGQKPSHQRFRISTVPLVESNLPWKLRQSHTWWHLFSSSASSLVCCAALNDSNLSWKRRLSSRSSFKVAASKVSPITLQAASRSWMSLKSVDHSSALKTSRKYRLRRAS